jgi:hypothetical protein
MLKYHNLKLLELLIFKFRKREVAKVYNKIDNNEFTYDTIVVSRPLRVTFVAGVGDMRVIRLAAAAQSAGIKTQLIIRQTTPFRDDMVHTEFFERVVWLDNWSWPWEVDSFQKNILEFNTDIIHCCMQLDANALAVYLLAICPLPLVGDAYDMVNVQYTPHDNFTKSWYPTQSALEQIWYRNVDGICFRSPYFSIMKRYRILPKNNCKITIVPEPLLSINNYYKTSTDSKNILLSPFTDNIEQEIELIGDALKGTNINCYVIPIDITKNIKFNERFTIIGQMTYRKYCDFLNTIDAYIQLPRKLSLYHPRVKKENAYLIWRNNWCDVIERGKHLFIPECYKFVFNYFKETQLVHFFGSDDPISNEFWNKKINNILQCQNIPDLSKYNYLTYGKKLEKFYMSILTKHN